MRASAAIAAMIKLEPEVEHEDDRADDGQDEHDPQERGGEAASQRCFDEDVAADPDDSAPNHVTTSVRTRATMTSRRMPTLTADQSSTTML